MPEQLHWEDKNSFPVRPSRDQGLEKVGLVPLAGLPSSLMEDERADKTREALPSVRLRTGPQALKSETKKGWYVLSKN